MKTAVLISCTKSKREYPCKARLLYDKSSKFRKSLEYAKTISFDIFAISSKYGLISLDTVIEPYDEPLDEKKKEERRAWGHRVAEQINKEFDIQNTEFVILAGKDYCEPLQAHLPHIQLPLCGLRQGECLAELDKLLRDTESKGEPK